ncbi:acyltransferase [Catellatospora paridis]|uniref:acyltransferase n=1 Tax=Catellatospora paridis TaxID=1617086 RepID=UPI0018AFFB80|nr:acyltransferase [Catellatospora paridis]
MTTTPTRTEPAAEHPAPGPTTADRAGRDHGLDVLRILAICSVVAIHVFGSSIRNEPKRSTEWWLAVAIDLGSSWAVPVFVMISGALLLNPKVHAAGPAAFYRRRFLRIVPAIVAWHVIYLVVVLGLLQNGVNLTGPKLGQLVIDANIVVAFYFLWLIAGLYLIAPVLAAFLGDDERRAKIFAAVALAWTMAVYTMPRMSALLGNSRPISLGMLTYWWPFVGYFAAGWALRNTVLSRRATVLAAVGALALLAEIAWQFGHTQYRLLHVLLPAHNLGTVCAVASILVFLVGIAVFRRITLPERVRRWIVRLSDASFGVFLVHLLVLAFTVRLVPNATASLSTVALTFAIVLPASFGISLVLARIPYLRAIV